MTEKDLYITGSASYSGISGLSSLHHSCSKGASDWTVTSMLILCKFSVCTASVRQIVIRILGLRYGVVL